jgi:hypothetical protein
VADELCQGNAQASWVAGQPWAEELQHLGPLAPVASSSRTGASYRAGIGPHTETQRVGYGPARIKPSSLPGSRVFPGP